MEFERQCPHQSFQRDSVGCNFAENEIENDRISLKTPNHRISNRQCIDESLPNHHHWTTNNRRRTFFAVKALAIIVLLGYIGRQHSLGAVQKFSSRRRLNYVSSPFNPKKVSLSATLGLSTSSKRSKTTQNQEQKQKRTNLEDYTNTTTTSLRGDVESSNLEDGSLSKLKNGVVKEESTRVSPKD